MAAAENEVLVRQIFDAFARKQGFSLRDCFADDAVWHVPGTGVMSGTYRGKHEIFRFLANLPKLTNGTYSSRIVDVLASDERAAGLYRASGERNGRTPFVPTTEPRVEHPAADTDALGAGAFGCAPA